MDGRRRRYRIYIFQLHDGLIMNLYTTLPKFVKEMTRAELEEYFQPGTYSKQITSGKRKGQWEDVPYYTKAYLMRSIIMNERQFNRSAESRTLRGMWYSSVKPTLDKLGLLEEADMTEEGLSEWDKKLSRYTCDLLRRGFLTFQDLSIYDISRQKSNPDISYYSGGREVFGYQGSVAQYPNILIATEKDTIYSILRGMAELFGCSCISCKGQNSLGAMERVIRGMIRSDVEFDTIYILTLTDYDPAGYYIAEALEGQARDILHALEEDWIDVEIKRIGITPDQLSEELVQQNKYTPKKANLAKWMERTGGINGEEKGLELDALSSSMIRQIFIEELRPYIDPDVYKTFLKRSYVKQKVLEVIKDRFEETITSIIDHFEPDVEIIEDFDIFQLGLKGQRSIYVDESCKDNMDQMIEKISINMITEEFNPEDYE